MAVGVVGKRIYEETETTESKSEAEAETAESVPTAEGNADETDEPKPSLAKPESAVVQNPCESSSAYPEIFLLIAGEEAVKRFRVTTATKVSTVFNSLKSQFPERQKWALSLPGQPGWFDVSDPRKKAEKFLCAISRKFGVPLKSAGDNFLAFVQRFISPGSIWNISKKSK